MLIFFPIFHSLTLLFCLLDVVIDSKLDSPEPSI